MPDPAPEHRTPNTERRPHSVADERAAAAFRGLPIADRVVLMLRHSDGLTSAQIAQVTEEPLWRVRERLAVATLRIQAAYDYPW